MNRLWVRALAAGIVVILAALLLKVLPSILVLAIFVGGIALVFVTGRRRARAPDHAGGGAELLGLRRETADPFGILGYPMTLFGRVDDPAIGELVWGPWRGLDVHAFELSFEPPSPSGEPRGRATFACAMATAEGPIPGFVAEPQTFLTLFQAVPPGEAIESGDPSFDTAMNAWAEDGEYARRVLDDSGRAWLRSLDLRWGVEVRGQLAMIYGPKPERPDLVTTLETLRDLLERLPKGQGASSAQA